MTAQAVTERSTVARKMTCHGIQLLHMGPGKPQQNACVERYNRTERYDWLGQYLLETLEVVQEYATRWLWHYSHERPNMGLVSTPTEN